VGMRSSEARQSSLVPAAPKPRSFLHPWAVATALILGAGGLCGQKQLASGGDESWPSFCEQVPPGMLHGIQFPYGPHTTEDGGRYCEGILPNPIAAAPLEVRSVKQVQPVPDSFDGKRLLLTWCGGSKSATVNVKLSAATSPLFSWAGSGRK